MAILAHVETLGYWFTSTDTISLIASSHAHTVEEAARILSQPMMEGTRFTNVALFYRPLASLSYAFDYALWGLDPTGYHLTNLLLHGTATALAALVVAALTDRETGGVAGLLVALHPITVEVVPSAARRHDVLMTVFWLAALFLFVRSRRRNSRRLLAGSLGAFSLALLSKEPALLLPGLVFAWVALDELGEGLATTQDAVRILGESLRAVAPFAIVTVAYLGVRISVLGGLGGYQREQARTLHGAVVIVAKYVLSLTYPSDVVTAAVESVGRGPAMAVVVALVILAIALLGVAVRGRSQDAGSAALALAVAAGGVGSLPLVTVLAGRIGFGEVLLGYPHSHSIVYGILFVASLVTGALLALVALGSQHPLFDTESRRTLAFFGVWVAAPLALFLLSGEFTVRSAYPFLAPAMGLVAVLLVTAVRNVDLDAPSLDASTALAAVATVFVLSLAVTSPVVHSYDGWRTSGEVNEVTLTSLEAELADEPDDAKVAVSGIPRNVTSQQDAFPRAKSVGYVRAGTIEAWLQLRDPGNEMVVGTPDLISLRRTPTGASLATEKRNGKIRIQMRYTYRAGNDPRNGRLRRT